MMANKSEKQFSFFTHRVKFVHINTTDIHTLCTVRRILRGGGLGLTMMERESSRTSILPSLLSFEAALELSIKNMSLSLITWTYTRRMRGRERERERERERRGRREEGMEEEEEKEEEEEQRKNEEERTKNIIRRGIARGGGGCSSTPYIWK